MTPHITLITTPTQEESEHLDSLLWEVLWKPLGLPRTFREFARTGGGEIMESGEICHEYECVAMKDGVVTGGLVAIFGSSSKCEIRHIAVLPEEQDKGCGTMLIEALVAYASGKGFQAIHTIARNTSVPFFLKAGFACGKGNVPDHPIFLQHGISFVMMERRL
ncbi:hypothetical protein KTGMC3_P1408 [Methanocalculus sp. MC3]